MSQNVSISIVVAATTEAVIGVGIGGFAAALRIFFLQFDLCDVHDLGGR